MKDPIPKTAHVMIIGAMKAGTTTLFEMLKNHPEICPAKIKEPEFFSKNQGHGANVSNYSDLFEFDASVHTYVLEASTGYTKFPKESNVPERIKQAGLEPKFIYIVRDPVKRIISNLNFSKNHPQWSDAKSNLGRMINFSNYYLQLSQYRNHFPKESILILDFDELKSDPNAFLQRVCIFLNISQEFKLESFKKSNVTVVKGDFELYLRKHFQKWFKYIPEGLKAKTRESIEKHAKPVALELTDSELKEVRDALVDDMQAFKKEYGFDVAKWGF